MPNAECSDMTKAATIVLALVASVSLASEISVEPRRVRVGEPVEITVQLDDSFAHTDRLGLPITNLEIESGPSVSSEFRWSNGEASRSKIYRYIARAKGKGTARVGPIDLVDRDGRRLHLDAVSITVLPDDLPSLKDPAAALAQSRRGLSVTAQIDKSEVFLGEQAVLTWTLYSRSPVRGFRLTSVPVLEDFWVEEIPQTRQESEQVLVGGEIVHRTVVRRVAVYPLRTGPQAIAPLEVMAEVFLPDDFFRGWGLFERRIEDIRVRSGTMQIRVRPVPAGAAAVGELSLECGAPRVSSKGPVVMDVTLSGTGNLRSAHAPSFVHAPEAALEVQSRETRVTRDSQPIRMTRTWRFLFFPRGPGVLEIPPLQVESFDPTAARNRMLRCEAQSVNVVAGYAGNTRAASSAPPRQPERPGPRNVNVPFAIGIAALVVSGAVWAAAIRSRMDSSLVDAVWSRRDEPRALRRALHDAVIAAGFRPAELLSDQTSLGESYRSLHSLVDLVEKEPWEAPSVERELRRRIRELDREIRKRS